MKTISDYPSHAEVSIKLYIDKELIVEVAMTPIEEVDGIEVVLVRWEDFSISDLRDLLRHTQKSLTRLLVRDHDIEITLGDNEVDEQEDRPF